MRARDTRKRGGIAERLGAAAAVVSDVKNGLPAAIVAHEQKPNERVTRKRPAHSEADNVERMKGDVRLTYFPVDSDAATSSSYPSLTNSRT